MSFKKCCSSRRHKKDIKPGLNFLLLFFLFGMLSGFRLYSILFRFRISKFKERRVACMAIGIQLDNILSWVRRDISRYLSSVASQLGGQILKSGRYFVLEVSFFCFILYFSLHSSTHALFPSRRIYLTNAFPCHEQ